VNFGGTTMNGWMIGLIAFIVIAFAAGAFIVVRKK
jgi:F0F1-type ATP synthase assembly protein I